MADLAKISNRKLREALDAPDGTFISRHRDYIERVRSIYPHTIQYRDLIDEGTCVTCALQIGSERAYWAIANEFDRRIFAGKGFVEWLIQGHLVEIDAPKAGCLALYFNDGNWQHIGVVFGAGRVISQWGQFPVYEHDVTEVPARYGDEVRYFEMPARGESLRLFLEYAKTSGVSDAHLAKATKT